MKITLIHDRQRWLIALFCLAIPAGILFAMTGVRIINRLATPASETGAVRHQTAVKSLNPATPAQAGGNYTITKSVITGGGDRSIGGNVELTGSIGQSLIGDSSGGPYSLGGGFWFKSISCPSITINPILSTLPAGVVGVAYSQTFTQTGGMGAATFNISSGTVPPGLNLSSGGVLSGTPTQTGTFNNLVVTATDSNNCTGARTYSLVVNCPTINVNPTTLPTANIGLPYSQQLTQTAGIGAIAWSSAGTLPNNLTLSAGGLLSGTPTASGTFNFTVRATDANGCFGERAFTITVNACPSVTISPNALPGGLVGTAYNQTLTASGGTPGTPAWGCK